MSGIWPATHQQDPSGVRSFHFVMMKSPFLIHVSWSNPISQPFIMVKSCQIPIFHGENAHNLDSSPLLLVESWCFAHHSEPRHGPSRAPAGRRHDPKRLPYRWWATATCGAQWRWKSRGGFPVVMGVPPVIPAFPRGFSINISTSDPQWKPQVMVSMWGKCCDISNMNILFSISYMG